MREEFDVLRDDVEHLKHTVINLPNKSYLDDKLADLEGSVVASLRKEDNKLNRLVESLEKFKVLPKEELDLVRNIQVFPSVSRVS